MPATPHFFRDDTRLIQLLVDLKENESLSLVRELMSRGVDPLKIIECCQAGMRDVGNYYETGRYYISGLMMAGEILRQVMELVLPALRERIQGAYSGRILIGTVQGDIHDIGKNLVAMLFRCHGFEVLDLGVDVSPPRFLENALNFRPDVVAMSALLTTVQDVIRETIALIMKEASGDLKSCKTIVGGGFMDEKVCRYVGADYWAKDAMSGVRYCQKLTPPL
ncbi:MAG: cobalamin-dependent protein [Pseudomonadota bacterium]